MKTWQRRIKFKPGFSFFHCRGLVPHRYGEEHQIELMESIYRKENFWPDRLTPLTEEEKAFKAECEANRPTLEEISKTFDEIYGDANYGNQVYLVSENAIKELASWMEKAAFLAQRQG